jgi:GNAT superfamily N-acetyltransferase
MSATRVVDVTDAAAFGLVPPCADPAFDHRSCDYWEDAARGSKAARSGWLGAAGSMPAPAPRRRNPFAEGDDLEPLDNPFAPRPSTAQGYNPFADTAESPVVDNPFARVRPARPSVGPDAPRKLGLLGRGLGVFGSYAKVLLVDDVAVAYAQFGPLSAYPRALQLRELYPQLPDAPLPAVITCIATTREARRAGHAGRLVRAVCDDLATRGFSAVEAYPETGARPDATSGATIAFWLSLGFVLAVDDERFPVVRRELG